MKRILFVCVTLSMGLFGCGSSNEKHEEHRQTSTIVGDEKNRTIMLTEREIQMAHVRVGLPEPGSEPSPLSAAGKIIPRPSGSSVVAPRFGGRLIRLLVKEPGETIRAGQAVAVLYSPELQSLLREYQSAVEQQSKDLINAAIRRLNNLGLAENEIIELTQQNKIPGELTVTSTVTGVISKVLLSEGQFVEAGAPIIRCESGNGIWSEIELYSSDGRYLDDNTVIKIYHQGTNQLIGDGLLSHILQEKTSNQNIRYLIEIRNAEMNPTPGTKISAQLLQKGPDTYSLPLEAVVWSGNKSFVFIEKQKLAFDRREVKVGQTTANRVNITSGIDKTDRIALSGGYLLQSTYQLRFGDLP